MAEPREKVMECGGVGAFDEIKIQQAETAGKTPSEMRGIDKKSWPRDTLYPQFCILSEIGAWN